MDELELGWLACAIDSEGSPYIADRYVTIVITNTHRQYCEHVKELVGCGKVLEVKTQYRGWKVCYKWQTYRKEDVLRILTLVYPHLIVRKERARLMIEYCKKCVDWWKKYGKYTNHSPALRIELQAIREQLQQLQKKGP